MIITLERESGGFTLFNPENVLKIENSQNGVYVLFTSGIGNFFIDTFTEVQEMIKAGGE